MKIYIDTSCLKRPFDNQAQADVRLETEAVMMIFKGVEIGRFQLSVQNPVDFLKEMNP